MLGFDFLVIGGFDSGQVAVTFKTNRFEYVSSSGQAKLEKSLICRGRTDVQVIRIRTQTIKSGLHFLKICGFESSRLFA